MTTPPRTYWPQRKPLVRPEPYPVDYRQDPERYRQARARSKQVLKPMS